LESFRLLYFFLLFHIILEGIRIKFISPICIITRIPKVLKIGILFFCRSSFWCIDEFFAVYKFWIIFHFFIFCKLSLFFFHIRVFMVYWFLCFWLKWCIIDHTIRRFIDHTITIICILKTWCWIIITRCFWLSSNRCIPFCCSWCTPHSRCW